MFDFYWQLFPWQETFQRFARYSANPIMAVFDFSWQLFLWRETFQRLARYSANQTEFIVISHKNGLKEHKPGYVSHLSDRYHCLGQFSGCISFFRSDSPCTVLPWRQSAMVNVLTIPPFWPPVWPVFLKHSERVICIVVWNFHHYWQKEIIFSIIFITVVCKLNLMFF